MQRLDKFLAEAGVDSRRKLRDMVRSGRVTVNGSLVLSPEQKIDETRDVICVDGQRIGRGDRRIVLMLHKPAGCVTAARDDRYPTVMEHLPPQYAGLMPIGRLDKDTEGLLIITNDGDLAHRLLSPKKHVDKTYYVELDGRLSTEEAERIMGGIDIGDERPTLPCEITRLSDTTCFITIREGRYHEIKRMFATGGLKVKELKRISMGPIALDAELGAGEYRPLTEEEIQLLRNFDKTEDQTALSK